jgi:putative tricarboxylic transport membrane protein
MTSIIGMLAEAFLTLFAWPNIGYAIAGTIIGLVFGAIPGLGSVISLSLLIPLSFGMEATSAMILFGTSMGGAKFGGSVTAILMNTPGTAGNVVSTFEGYPLSQQGRSEEAIGISATASALGAIFGLVILLALIPVASTIILSFGAPENFWIALLGLVAVGVLGEGDIVRSLAIGGAALMLSFIGFSNISGVYRYGLDTQYLWDGIQLIPVIIGVFAVTEAIRLTKEASTIDQSDTEDTSSVLEGVYQVFRHPFVFFRSSATGTLVGLIPGLGGLIASFISYFQTVQASDDPDKFGTGVVEGFIATESSNDAMDGGALLPTVTFGIPGSPVMAVLLGGFLFHGLSPGLSMLSDDLNVLIMLILALALSNVVSSTIGLVLGGRLAEITRVPVKTIVPLILAVSVFGVFALRNNMLDVVVAAVFGIIGYVMVAFDYSRITLILGLILGPILEGAFYQSLQFSGGSYSIFVTRPVSVGIIIVMVLIIGVAYRKMRQNDLEMDQDAMGTD